VGRLIFSQFFGSKFVGVEEIKMTKKVLERTELEYTACSFGRTIGGRL
jgi:hypothetical protein